MNQQKLLEKIHVGEDSQTQFKSDVTLPYRGLGTGIRRALIDWPNIYFHDEREGDQFKVTIFRSADPETKDLTQKEFQI